MPVHALNPKYTPDQASGAVFVEISVSKISNEISADIYYDATFSFIDDGDVYPQADRLVDGFWSHYYDNVNVGSGGSSSGSRSNSSGSSSGSSSASSGSSGRQCSSCGGRGKVDCRSCYGKGYVEEYTWGEGGGIVTKNCPNINCHDGKVDCNVCGGDGWID